MLAFPPFQALFSTARALFGAALLAFREPAGLFTDFTVADQTKSVLVRNNGDTYSSPDAFFSNAGTSPKLVYDATGTLVWSPHNLFVSPSSPATQNVTLITGATYTYGVTGSGSLAGTSGASGTASAGSPVTFVATGTTGTFTKTGSLSTIQINRGSVLTAFLDGGASARFGLAIDYDPVTHACKGLLVEAAATNVLTHTGDGYASGWILGSAAFSGTTAGPDGQQSLKKLTPNTSNIGQQVYQGFTATVAAYTNSIIAKAGGYSWLGLCFGSGGTAATDGAYFNLSTGVVGTVAAGSTAAIQSLGGGLYRCSVTRTLTAATWYQQIEVHSADNTGSMAGDGTSGIYVGFSQCELGSVATSPIPTFAATVTRARDLPNYLLSAIPSVATAVGMFAEFQQTSQESTVTRVISLDDGTTGTRAFIAVTTSQFRGGVVDATVAQATNDVGSTAVNTTQRAAFSATANDFRFAAGGVLSSRDASGTYPTVTTGRLGYDAQSQALVGGLYIRKFSIVPRILTDGELQAKST